MDNLRETSIATRMLSNTIGMYLLIVTVVSAVHIVAEYKFQKEAIYNSLNGGLIGFGESLAVSLWGFDEEALEAITTGILKIPEIVGVEVYDSENNLIVIGGSKEKEKSVGEDIYHIDFGGISSEDMVSHHTVEGRNFHFFEKSAYIHFFSGGSEKFIGKVILFSNTAVIFEKLKVRIAMLLLNVIATLIVFSFAFLFAINRYLRKPLTLLIRATANISIDNIGEFALELGGSRRDELHILGETIVNMSKDLHLAIKDRSAAINDLEQSKKNLAITLESIGDGVIATDKAGFITRMNKVAQNLTGWHLEEAIGKPLDEVFHVTELLHNEVVDGEKEVVLQNPVELVLARRDLVEISTHAVLKGKDLKRYQISESAAPIKAEYGEILGIVLVFRDITEEIELQEQLQHGQRMDAIGQLAGGVAHDFNNMLGGIIGAAELLQTRVKGDAESFELAQLIVESSGRAAELTQQLLSFARKQQGASSSINVHQVIKDSISLLSRTIDRRISIVSQLDAESFYVIGDPAQLQSVFMNLGINASHAMIEGGKVFIRTKVTSLDADFCEQSLSKLIPGDYIEIKVTDTGEGIPAEHLHKVFEPFFTTKEQGRGTGLGLAAVYGTIEQHQGVISVNSEVGKGTTFDILLPLTEGGNPDKSLKRPPVIKGRGTILVVDDERVMRATASGILKDLGYDVILAEDGEKALEIFEDKHKTIDVVLLDMIMPNINGRDCFLRMMEIDLTARIILSSGFSRKEDVEEMKKAGLSGFIVKPYRRAGLSHIIHDVLEETKKG